VEDVGPFERLGPGAAAGAEVVFVEDVRGRAELGGELGERLVVAVEAELGRFEPGGQRDGEFAGGADVDEEAFFGGGAEHGLGAEGLGGVEDVGPFERLGPGAAAGAEVVFVEDVRGRAELG
ncbi:hypothetical protein ADL26_16835, partial [Thermoactinomyces vulgaris]